MNSGSRVASFGHYQPVRVVTNDALAETADTTDEWVQERLGIRERRLAGHGESVADMATAAATAALARAGTDAAEVDLVVVATCTAADRMPNVATRVAGRLGIRAPGAFDVNVACAGFSHALAIVDHAIRADASRRALVVGVDRMSDYIDWTDRSTCVIFGDGAGAAVVEATPPGAGPGIGPVVWGSDPGQSECITISRSTGELFRQEGQAVFRWATTALAPIAVEACRRAGVAPADLAGIVTHQANLRIINAIARKLGADDAVVATDLVESGNTSAASIPLALSKLLDPRTLAEGSPVLLLGFGAGLTYAGQVIRCP
jgi:3-oxoacyl-[acyl-carrier-protein] synthase-3